MSGHRVVAILDSFQEGYVYGGTVHRRKQSILSGQKLQPSVYTDPNNPLPQPNAKVIDLVLSHKGAFKLKSKAPPPPAAGASSQGSKDVKKKAKFSRRGGDVDNNKNEASNKVTPATNEDDDDEEDLLDADAMMRAAAEGEDIQRLYATLNARREARAKARAEAGGASVTTGGAGNKPEVIWRQEHCFVRAVTPLLGLAEEDEEANYQRALEEEEAQRLKDEEEEAKRVLEHALQDTSNKLAPHSPVRKRVENADSAPKMSEEMQKRRNVPPAELAADKSMKDSSLNGFVVHYFALGKCPKATVEETETGKHFTQCVKEALATAASGSSSFFSLGSSSSPSPSSSVPVVRYRTYVCASNYDQQEWLMVYRNTLLNYWHERLEASVIMAPEIFQFQAFAMNLGGGSGSSSSFLNNSYPIGGVLHAVLSTTALYLIPRSNKSEFEVDDRMRFVRIPVEAIASLTINKAKGTLALSGGPLKAPHRFGFFTPHECTEFVIEVQRIWEMCSPAAAGEGAFPYQVEK